MKIETWIHNRRAGGFDCECYHRSRPLALVCHWLRRGRNLRLDVQSLEVVLVEAPKGQTLEEWQEDMAELRRRAREEQG